MRRRGLLLRLGRRLRPLGDLLDLDVAIEADSPGFGGGVCLV